MINKFGPGKLYLNYGTKEEKLIGKVKGPDKYYFLLDYRSVLPNNELYDNDPELTLTDKDFMLFKTETSYLFEVGFKIIECIDNYGWCIIEDSIDTPEIKGIPFLTYNPDIMACSNTGYPCDLCGPNCNQWKDCKHIINTEYKENSKLKEIAVKKFFGNIFKDLLIKEDTLPSDIKKDH